MSEKIQLFDVIDRAIKNNIKKVHTMSIAKITSVNEKTIDCQLVMAKLLDGETLQPPVLVDVPVVFMKGGDSYTAHPVAVDDYCLVFFSERCYDAWYSGSDNVVPPDFRMHDYSDGFALVGVNPLDASISIPEVITQIGDTYFEGNHEHVGDLIHEGNTTQTGNTTQEGNVDLTGDQTVSGNVDAGTYSVGGTSGASGTFISKDDKTITVVNGLITNIA